MIPEQVLDPFAHWPALGIEQRKILSVEFAALKERIPKQFSRAATKLRAFAERNFPANEKLKHLVVFAFDNNVRIILAGGRVINGDGQREVIPPNIYTYRMCKAENFPAGERGINPVPYEVSELSDLKLYENIFVWGGKDAPDRFLIEAGKIVNL